MAVLGVVIILPLKHVTPKLRRYLLLYILNSAAIIEYNVNVLLNTTLLATELMVSHDLILSINSAISRT